jgi:hypothetical protein
MGNISAEEISQNFTSDLAASPSLKKTKQASSAKEKEQLRYLDALQIPVMAVDRNFGIRFINAFGVRLLGLCRSEEAARKKCFDLFKLADFGTEKFVCRQAMNGAAVATPETTAILCKLKRSFNAEVRRCLMRKAKLEAR